MELVNAPQLNAVVSAVSWGRNVSKELVGAGGEATVSRILSARMTTLAPMIIATQTIDVKMIPCPKDLVAVIIANAT